MKWLVEDDIEFKRNDFTPVVFTFDNAKVWFEWGSSCSTISLKSSVQKLGKQYGAKTVTLKRNTLSEEEEFDAMLDRKVEIVAVSDLGFGEYSFYTDYLVQKGEKMFYQKDKWSDEDVFEQ